MREHIDLSIIILWTWSCGALGSQTARTIACCLCLGFGYLLSSGNLFRGLAEVTPADVTY